MSLNYRELRDGDLALLQGLLLELGYSVSLTELSHHIAEIVKRGGQIILAVEGDDVVGSICVVIDVRLAEGIYAEIVSLIVTAKYRGKGVGKGLVNMAENWARGKVNKIRVRANVVRKEAHFFYQSQGFKRNKTQEIFIKIL